MKELSIEEKAQRYDKALEKARQLCAYPTSKPFISDLQDLFPELKESEDERIRKLLVEAVIQVLQDQYCYNRGVSKEKVLAWLEKQGEHANFRNKIQVGDKVTLNEDGVLVNLTQLNRVVNKGIENAIKAKQGEKPRYSIGDVLCDKSCTTLNKDAQPNFEIVDIRNGLYICDKGSFPISQQDNYELVAKKIEQKPAWSEEDESFYKSCLRGMRTYEGCDTPVSKWVKSIKKRLQAQPKQEWSEEDNAYRMLLIDILNVEHPNGIFSLNDDYMGIFKCDVMPAYKIVKWLEEIKDKSLRPQSHWKPSDEQMLAINTAINVLGKGTINGKYLIELHEQLKKLREEDV